MNGRCYTKGQESACDMWSNSVALYQVVGRLPWERIYLHWRTAIMRYANLSDDTRGCNQCEVFQSVMGYYTSTSRPRPKFATL